MFFNTNNERKTSVLLQAREGESGAMCLAMMLEYYNSKPSLNDIKRLCSNGKDELNPSNYKKAIESYHLDCEVIKSGIDGIKEHLSDSPVILHTNSDGYILCVSYKNGKFILHDPELGLDKKTKEELEDVYAGLLLKAVPNKEFVKENNRLSFLDGLKRTLYPNLKPITYVLIAGVILLIPGVVIPALNKLFFDDIIIQGQVKWFRPMLSLMGAFLILGCILVFVQQKVLLRTELKMSIAKSAEFVDHIFKLPISYFQKFSPGETIKRIKLNDEIAVLLSSDFVRLIMGILTALFYGIIMLKYNLILSIVGIGIMLLNIIGVQYFSKKRTALNQARFQKKQATFNVATVGIEQIETLKSSGAENDFFSLWSGHLVSTINKDQDLGITSRILDVLPDFISRFNNAVVLLLGGVLIMYGEISIGVFIALQSFIAHYSDPIKDLVDVSGEIQLNRGNMNNLMATQSEPIDEFNKLENRTTIDEVNPFNAKLEGKVEVKDLVFSYEKYSPLIVNGFDLIAEPGKHIAIVGGSGSGKSTILKIIAGLYTPNSGKILIDDQAALSLNPDVFRNSVSMVDQDIFLFTGSISDNITMWNRAIPNDKVIQAAKDARIHETIAMREDSYQAKISPGGGNFSGGQKQRIEIARALVTDPSILLLDEATSALDAETEKIVINNIRERNCTTISIAHRLSTIRLADEIIVLDQGNVVQRGDHESLIQDKSGIYHQLIEES